MRVSVTPGTSKNGVRIHSKASPKAPCNGWSLKVDANCTGSLFPRSISILRTCTVAQVWVFDAQPHREIGQDEKMAPNESSEQHNLGVVTTHFGCVHCEDGFASNPD